MEIKRLRLINKESKGCEKASVEVIRALREIKCNEDGKKINVDKLNLDEIHVNLENIEESYHTIFENSKEVFEKNFKAFFIGGDEV